MNILCRVDANSEIGTGHLMRCLALAQHLTLKDIKVSFVINPATEQFCHSRNDWIGQIILLPPSLTLNEEVDWIKTNAEERSYQAVLVDGYQFDKAYRYQLSKLNKPLIIFDDNNNSGDLFADLVINASDHAFALSYQQTAPDAKLALGSNYRVLRREFTDVLTSLADHVNRKCLTIIMGGSDPANITYSLLQSLNQLNADMPILVLTGRGYLNTAQLKQFLNDSKLSIIYKEDCQDVAKQFLQSKLVISAAGSSQFEISACGAVALLVVVADNQLGSALKAEELGLAKYFDCRASVESDKLATQVLALWENTEILEHMQSRASAGSQLNGSMNVVDEIMKIVKL